MDKQKKPGRPRALNKVNNNMYMTLKEIIREHALRYLPAKSLYRSNTVCKDWNSLISNPFFEHSQSCFSRSLSGLFGQTPGGPTFFISLDPLAYGVPDPEMKFLPEPVDLVASSNGLLCCRGRSEIKTYYMCNPVNRQLKMLPEPEADHGSFPAVVLVFEPSLLKFEADYKLICAFPSPDFHGAYEFEIYSSIDNSWKISPEICFGEQARVLNRDGVHLNGVAYWLTSDYFILAFDSKNNRATLIPYFADDDTLGVIDGKLCTSRRRQEVMNLWVLSNVHVTMTITEDNRWEKQAMTLDVKNLNIDLNTCGRSVLAIGSDLIVFHDGFAIFSYNLKTKEVKVVSGNGIDSEYDSNCFYVPYVNSLVRLQ